MTDMITVREMIKKVNAYPNGYWTYFPEEEVWEIDTMIMVLEPIRVPPEEDLSDEASVPIIARQRGLMEALSIGQVAEIINNVTEQDSNVTEEVIFEALLYYYDNDAFIDL